jgi:hypothetical protein
LSIFTTSAGRAAVASSVGSPVSGANTGGNVVVVGFTVVDVEFDLEVPAPVVPVEASAPPLHAERASAAAATRRTRGRRVLARTSIRAP